jgi:hypothetical protein
VSDYVGVEAEDHTLEFLASHIASPTVPPPLVRAFITFEPNQRYTILAVDSFPELIQVNHTWVFQHRNGIEPLTLLDDTLAPPPASARFRFVDASPSTVLADVYITKVGADISASAPTFRGLTYRSVATYITIPFGLYEVRVTIADTKTVVLDVKDLFLATGSVQTAIMLDGPGGGPPAILRRLNDR